MVGVVVASFVVELFHAKPAAGEVATQPRPAGLLRHREPPARDRDRRRDGDAPRHLPALGADPETDRRRDEAERKKILGFEKVDVVIAPSSLAGMVNLSMMIVAAALFHSSGLTGIDSIEGAFEGLKTLVSANAATVFGIALLGLRASPRPRSARWPARSSCRGFIRRTIPLYLRRAITLTPALLVLAIGFNPTDALVLSQVVLSFGIPFALVPLLLIARRRDIMGALANPGWLTALAGAIAALIIGLNVFLIADLFRLTEQPVHELGKLTGHARSGDCQVDPRPPRQLFWSRHLRGSRNRESGRLLAQSHPRRQHRGRRRALQLRWSPASSA